MATILEYAYLACDVYNDDDELSRDEQGYYKVNSGSTHHSGNLPHWVRLPKSNEKINYPPLLDTGFFARLYANQLTHETIVAYRGTNVMHWKDLKADFQLGEKQFIPRDLDAEHFYRWAKIYLTQHHEHRFSCFPKLTGHSLGGYLAQYVAIQHPGTIAVVFNAPGIGGLVDPTKGYINAHNPIFKKYIYNVDIDYDIVHKVGHLPGNVTLLHDNAYRAAIEKKARSILIPTSALFISNTIILQAGYFAIKEHVIAEIISNLQTNPAIGNQAIPETAVRP